MGGGEISIPNLFQRRNALLRIVQSNLTTRSYTAHLRKTRSEFQELLLKRLLPHLLLVFFPINTGKKIIEKLKQEKEDLIGELQMQEDKLASTSAELENLKSVRHNCRLSILSILEKIERAGFR